MIFLVFLKSIMSIKLSNLIKIFGISRNNVSSLLVVVIWSQTNVDVSNNNYPSGRGLKLFSTGNAIWSSL